MSKYSCISAAKAALTAPALVLDERSAAQMAELFRAFSDTSRVRIIAALADCELSVSALA